MLEAYFEANALYPKTNKFVVVSSLKIYRGLPRNAGLPFLVYFIKPVLFHIETVPNIHPARHGTCGRGLASVIKFQPIYVSVHEGAI